jgi:hypothetical protein
MHLTPNNGYASFMLRLQQAQSDNHPTWLISIQSTKTGNLRRFPSLDALIAFLRDEFGEQGKNDKSTKTELNYEQSTTSPSEPGVNH